MCAGQHLQNINWIMAFIIMAWFVITIIYIVVRATKSLHLGKATAYGVWVLVMEVTFCFTPFVHPIRPYITPPSFLLIDHLFGTSNS